MAEQTEYDPNDHTVAEVQEHLATLDPEGDEYAAVLQAERDGKNRVGIVGDDETPQGETTTEGGAKSPEDSASPEPEGEAYKKGYHGFVPSRDGDDPVDLTLAAVTKNQDA